MIKIFVFCWECSLAIVVEDNSGSGRRKVDRENERDDKLDKNIQMQRGLLLCMYAKEIQIWITRLRFIGQHTKFIDQREGEREID